MPHWLALVALAKTQVRFLHGGSQIPAMAVIGDAAPSSGLCRHPPGIHAVHRRISHTHRIK